MPKIIIIVNINRLFLFSILAPKGINKNGIISIKYLGPQATNPCQLLVTAVWKNMFSAKNERNNIQSDLFFLKKSKNEKNMVNRIGAKIKSPIPGENSNPKVGIIRGWVKSMKVDRSASKGLLEITDLSWLQHVELWVS